MMDFGGSGDGMTFPEEKKEPAATTLDDIFSEPMNTAPPAQAPTPDIGATTAPSSNPEFDKLKELYNTSSQPPPQNMGGASADPFGMGGFNTGMGGQPVRSGTMPNMPMGGMGQQPMGGFGGQPMGGMQPQQPMGGMSMGGMGYGNFNTGMAMGGQPMGGMNMGGMQQPMGGGQPGGFQTSSQPTGGAATGDNPFDLFS